MDVSKLIGKNILWRTLTNRVYGKVERIIDDSNVIAVPKNLAHVQAKVNVADIIKVYDNSYA